MQLSEMGGVRGTGVRCKPPAALGRGSPWGRHSWRERELRACRHADALCLARPWGGRTLTTTCTRQVSLQHASSSRRCARLGARRAQCGSRPPETLLRAGSACCCSPARSPGRAAGAPCPACHPVGRGQVRQGAAGACCGRGRRAQEQLSQVPAQQRAELCLSQALGPHWGLPGLQLRRTQLPGWDLGHALLGGPAAACPGRWGAVNCSPPPHHQPCNEVAGCAGG